MITIAIIGLLVYASIFIFSINKVKDNSEQILIIDVGHLYLIYVKEISKESQIEQIRDIAVDEIIQASR